MSKKIKYTDEPLGNLKVVPDFLPRPEDLVFREETGEGRRRHAASRFRASRGPLPRRSEAEAFWNSFGRDLRSRFLSQFQLSFFRRRVGSPPLRRT